MIMQISCGSKANDRAFNHSGRGGRRYYGKFFQTLNFAGLKVELDSNSDNIEHMFGRLILFYTNDIKDLQKKVLRDILQKHFAVRVSKLRGLLEDDEKAIFKI